MVRMTNTNTAAEHVCTVACNPRTWRTSHGYVTTSCDVTRARNAQWFGLTNLGACFASLGFAIAFVRECDAAKRTRSSKRRPVAS